MSSASRIARDASCMRSAYHVCPRAVEAGFRSRESGLGAIQGLGRYHKSPPGKHRLFINITVCDEIRRP